jgi:hypothetical protein
VIRAVRPVPLSVPLPLVRNPKAPKDLRPSVLALLYEFYETEKFFHRRSPSGHIDEDRERDQKILAEAGLIIFTVYGEAGAWGYNLTNLGCEIIKEAYNLDELRRDYWTFRREAK